MSKLIEKEGQFYKECGVVMLDTTSSKLLLDDNGDLYHYHKEQTSGGIVKPKHLYITSDDEIKDGDWYYDITLEQIIRANVNSDHNIYTGSCKKIIATTDTSLKIPDFPELENTAYTNLPQPSDKFIQAFIESYNKGEKIEKVLVEYKDYSPDMAPIYLIRKNENNNIIIKKVKDSWNREEVHSLMMQAWIHGEADKSMDYTVREKWIEENL